MHSRSRHPFPSKHRVIAISIHTTQVGVSELVHLLATQCFHGCVTCSLASTVSHQRLGGAFSAHTQDSLFHARPWNTPSPPREGAQGCCHKPTRPCIGSPTRPHRLFLCSCHHAIPLPGPALRQPPHHVASPRHFPCGTEGTPYGTGTCFWRWQGKVDGP